MCALYRAPHKKNLDDSHRLCNSDNLYSDNFGNLTSRASL